MFQFELLFISFFIDRVFGEFSFLKFITHPIVLMGRYISWFEKRYYKDSILRGAFLTISLIIIVFVIISFFAKIDNIFFQAFCASFCISSKMLFDAVKDVVTSNNSKEKIAMLVSRDTKDMSESDINKACVETYAENLSDGVIAPLFFLFLFGLEGAFIYKAINTLDSMVGYRTTKYEKFGKFSARLDDVVNFIPSRITAVLISVLFLSKKAFTNAFKKFGKLHESPNAGYPISAMAGVCNISLGGDTSYFGKVKKKPYFGDGRKIIEKEDVYKALSFRVRLDIVMIILFLVWSISN